MALLKSRLYDAEREKMDSERAAVAQGPGRLAATVRSASAPTISRRAA